MIIALDGPSGAGKSSVSVEVARRLGFSCLDTGAMYRSVAWRALQDGTALDDAAALGAIARNYDIAFAHEPGNPKPCGVAIGGVDVTRAIRTSEVDRAVSPVSAVPAVREALVAQQQRIGQTGSYVVEGRDIGTVVFPAAELKVFLTASDEARARRRVLQNEQRGVGSTDFDEVLADILRRDELDSTRAASPLVAASDAVHIDSSNMTMEEVVGAVCGLARERMGDGAAALAQDEGGVQAQAEGNPVRPESAEPGGTQQVSAVRSEQ